MLARSTAVDTAALRRIASQRRQDSLTRAGIIDPASPQSAIERYARAIESGSVDQLKRAYPGLTGPQQLYYQQSIFENGKNIKTEVRYGTVNKGKNTAEVDFTMIVKFSSSSSNERTTLPPRHQHAALRRTARGWQLVALTP
jgi:hypothetical protein